MKKKLALHLDLSPTQHLEKIYVKLNGRSFSRYQDGSVAASPLKEENKNTTPYYLRLLSPDEEKPVKLQLS